MMLIFLDSSDYIEGKKPISVATASIRASLDRLEKDAAEEGPSINDSAYPLLRPDGPTDRRNKRIAKIKEGCQRNCE